VNVCVDLPTILGIRDVIDATTGYLLDYGRATHTVLPDLADYLCAKNLTSAAPHSSVPSTGCDMEHNIPIQSDGATDRMNTTPIDRRWHRAKTHAGWTYEKDPGGTITWTSPTGLTCVIEPYDYRTGP
jgi:hypothetical protein